MHLSIRYKLFLALATSSMFATLLMAIVVQVNLRSDFSSFRTQQDINALRNILPQLQHHYQNNGNWNRIAENPALFVHMLRPRLVNRLSRLRHQDSKKVHNMSEPPSPPRHGPPLLIKAHSLIKRSGLIDASGHMLTPFDATVDYKIAIEVEGQIVGWLGLARAKGFSNQLDQQFINSQRKSLYTVAAAAMLFALMAALLLAKHFLRPVQRLAHSMDQLSRGNYAERVDIRRKDELGKLGQDLNLLALSLEKSESLRRQWVADTSHELRTPIAILHGEIEAIRDGIRPVTTQVISSLHEETLHLNKLIDDLHTLSLSDASALNYQMKTLALNELIAQLVSEFDTRAAQQGIRIEHHYKDRLELHADATRMQQLLYNLIENSLRYTDAPGQLSIHCTQQVEHIEIRLEDSSPAPQQEAIAHLFERFYRSEPSRNRKTGGSGLGLAICRNIVEAHQGSIQAYQAPSGGLGVRIKLPNI